MTTSNNNVENKMDTFWAQHPRFEITADLVKYLNRQFKVRYCMVSDETSDYSDIFDAANGDTEQVQEQAVALYRAGEITLEELLRPLEDWTQLREEQKIITILMMMPSRRNAFEKELAAMNKEQVPVRLIVLESCNSVLEEPELWGTMLFNSIDISRATTYRKSLWTVDQPGSIRLWEKGASAVRFRDTPRGTKPPFATPPKKFFVNELEVWAREPFEQRNIYAGDLKWKPDAESVNLGQGVSADEIPLELFADIPKIRLEEVRRVAAPYEADIQIEDVPSHASRKDHPRSLVQCVAFPESRATLENLGREIKVVVPEAIISFPRDPGCPKLLIVLPEAAKWAAELEGLVPLSMRLISDRAIVAHASPPADIRAFADPLEQWSKAHDGAILRVDLYQARQIENLYTRPRRQGGGGGPRSPVLRIRNLPGLMSGKEIWRMVDGFLAAAGDPREPEVKRVRKSSGSLMPWLYLFFHDPRHAEAVRIVTDECFMKSVLGRSAVLQVNTVPRDFQLNTGEKFLILVRPGPAAAAAAGGGGPLAPAPGIDLPTQQESPEGPRASVCPCGGTFGCGVCNPSPPTSSGTSTTQMTSPSPPPPPPPPPPSASPEAGEGKWDPFCFKCGEPGHWGRECVKPVTGETFVEPPPPGSPGALPLSQATGATEVVESQEEEGSKEGVTGVPSPTTPRADPTEKRKAVEQDVSSPGLLGAEALLLLTPPGGTRTALETPPGGTSLLEVRSRSPRRQEAGSGKSLTSVARMPFGQKRSNILSALSIRSPPRTTGAASSTDDA